MNQIKKMRMQNLMKQKQLAELIGVKQATVSAWESGKAFPDHKKLPKLAEILGTTTDELLKDD